MGFNSDFKGLITYNVKFVLYCNLYNLYYITIYMINIDIKI